jgi:hypothetical protein
MVELSAGAQALVVPNSCPISTGRLIRTVAAETREVQVSTPSPGWSKEFFFAGEGGEGRTKLPRGRFRFSLTKFPGFPQVKQISYVNHARGAFARFAESLDGRAGNSRGPVQPL